jgi:hypothetical protein
MAEVLVDLQAEKKAILDLLKNHNSFKLEKNSKLVDSLKTGLDIVLSESVLYSCVTPEYAAITIRNFNNSLYEIFGRIEEMDRPSRNFLYRSIKVRVGFIISLAIDGKALQAKTDMTKVTINQTSQQSRPI